MTDQTVSAFRRALLDWYDRAGRTLPWRYRPGDNRPRNAYHVWLSEVMLQQTTVAHGTRYWEAFVETFPTVTDLANAPAEQVMGMWAGLGYYARARNLHACAQRVRDDFDGVFPTDEATLLTLPGIGPYTAAAIAAICAGAPTNVVDGNVERVMSRLFAVETALPKARTELRRLAASLVRPDRASDYPQALMDLGATVCRPTSPLCTKCPVSRFCKAHSRGDPARFPLRKPKLKVPTRRGLAFVARRGDQLWLTRRPESGLLGGTLGFPTTEWGEGLLDSPDGWSKAGVITHVFSHFRLELVVLTGRQTVGEGAWHDQSCVDQMPSVMRKVWDCATN